jgi:hypothetical protein
MAGRFTNMDEQLPLQIAERLASCPGMDVVALGGSVATKTADADSDIDLGLYYRPENPLDLGYLRQLVAEIDDQHRGDAVTDFGDWGPWVNGGAWIEVQGQRVDLLYRDVASVGEAIQDCRAGRVETYFQVGHPAGFSPQIYAAEIHLCSPLHDARSTIATLKHQTWPYPPDLRRALAAGLWEADFLLNAASKSVNRGDVHHVAGSAFRSVVCMVQAMFGLNERYWTNEKGSVSLVDSFRLRPEHFGRRIGLASGQLGTGPDGLQRSLERLLELLVDTQSICKAEIEESPDGIRRSSTSRS